MDNSEIQKLISIFLGLAIIISSGTFIFLDLFSSQNKISVENSLVQDSNNSKSEFEGKTAFVESPKSLPSYYTTISLDSEFQPSGNLTDDYASYAAREIVKANPSGPQVDESGNQNLTVPDVDKLSNNFATNLVSGADLPNWDKNIENIYSNIKITKLSSTTISDYLNQLNEFYKNYSKINYEELLNKNSSENLITLDIITQQNNDLLKKFSETIVPENLINFHKSLIKTLVYEKNLIESAQKINNDPLYVYYVLQNNNEKINNALNDLQLEAEKIGKISYNNFPNSKLNDLLEKTIFIPKSYALFGFSVVFDPAAVAQLVTKNMKDILSWLKKLATEILKDQLMHRLINQIIRWVQGGGKPQFITDWKRFLQNAVSQGTGSALQQIYPRICQPFQPLIQIAFQNVNTYDNNVSCTLGDIVNNLKNFYDDFKYGGWVSYASIINPNGNFLGQFITVKDITLKEAASEKEAQKSDAESSKGFLSTKVCVKQKITSVEKRLGLAMSQLPNTKVRCGPINEPGLSVTENACAVITCEQYENKTPGALIGDVVGQSLPMGPISRIANAQDITALVSALVNSALNKLIKIGVGGLTGLFSGGGNGNNTSETNSLPEGAVSNPEDPCYGLVPGTDEYNDCKEVKNNDLYQTDLKTEQSTLLQQARTILDNLKKSLQADQEFLNIATKVQSDLQIIGGCSNSNQTSASTQSSTSTSNTVALCPNLADQACTLNSQIGKAKTSIEQKEIGAINTDIKNVSNIIVELDSNQVALERLQEIQKELSTYNDITINKPQERLKTLQEIQTAANQNINQSPQCQTSLPNF